jgi:hypothetical protein
MILVSRTDGGLNERLGLLELPGQHDYPSGGIAERLHERKRAHW